VGHLENLENGGRGELKKKQKRFSGPNRTLPGGGFPLNVGICINRKDQGLQTEKFGRNTPIGPAEFAR